MTTGLSENPVVQPEPNVTEVAPVISAAEGVDISSSTHFVVGIGASAGGLEALEKFFANTPRQSALSFLVVQHLSPDHKSFMVELLSKRTQIPVLQAEDGLEIKPDHIYLIPPKKILKIYRGRLLVAEREMDRGFNMPIDILFRSLAEERQYHAIGVILSGTGSDGTMGIRAIKDAGGLVMVQSEATAQFGGMPHNAIATGLADYILSPEEMPAQLMQYVRHPFVARDQTIARDQGPTETLMHKIFALLRERCGVDFANYKPSTIDRRIARRISINHLNNLEEYYNYLEISPREAGLLLNDILICVTRFFRDRDSFEYLANSIIPDILGRVPAGGSIRVWSPSCSTGEEAYSLAMLFAEEMARQEKLWDLKIFATDIAKAAIESASLGLYSDSEVADVPPDKLKTFFSQTSEGWQISRPIRQMVLFAQHDLLKDPPFTRLDLISCRNALIYFQPELQTKVLGLFHFALKPEGILFLGSSESTGELADRFQTLSARHKVFRMLPGGRPRDLQFTMPSPALPDPPVPYLPARASSAQMRVLDAIYHDIIADYAPPCVVVDERHDILHIFGKAGDYLKHHSGNFSNNLLKLTSYTLSPALATAMHRAAREGKEAIVDNVIVEQEDVRKVVRLRVKPLKPQRHGASLRLVFIEEIKIIPAKPVTVLDLPSDPTASSQRIHDLEHELVYTKESLQAAVEELETANEELQATNEELQSTNEELLASNEQLQSSNEELQSVNEELHTVNTENQNRIEELTELGNDINNLLATSGVGTMLVDSTLHLRRISKTACAMARLTPMEVGAPLEVLSRTLPFPELGLLAQRVADRGDSVERVITQEDGRNLLVRILPYRTETNQPRGLVVTLIDITERKKRLDLIQGILDAIPARVAVVNELGEVICVNASWSQGPDPITPGSSPPGVGRNFFDYCRQFHADWPSVEEWLAGFEDVLAGRRARLETELQVAAPGGAKRFRLTADPLPGQQRGLVITLLDMTEHFKPRFPSARSDLALPGGS